MAAAAKSGFLRRSWLVHRPPAKFARAIENPAAGWREVSTAGEGRLVQTGMSDNALIFPRFVFMSPRNMRLTKEIAAQMGIDIAWNAAISLRPLGDGEEDQHRMISNYADWDINAKLPHGIESVKRHLRDVDNVPLLVSLFTDVTKPSTRQMVR